MCLVNHGTTSDAVCNYFYYNNGKNSIVLYITTMNSEILLHLWYIINFVHYIHDKISKYVIINIIYYGKKIGFNVSCYDFTIGVNNNVYDILWNDDFLFYFSYTHFKLFLLYLCVPVCFCVIVFIILTCICFLYSTYYTFLEICLCLDFFDILDFFSIVSLYTFSFDC